LYKISDINSCIPGQIIDGNKFGHITCYIPLWSKEAEPSARENCDIITLIAGGPSSLIAYSRNIPPQKENAFFNAHLCFMN
jgi:hypothetical protein